MFGSRLPRKPTGTIGKLNSHINLQSVRRHATQTRLDLLKSVYHPAFASLKKDSPEYLALARSGKVWENFFKPENIEPYLQAQSDLKQTLSSIDELKLLYQKNEKSKIALLRALVPEYAHQSTSLEQNPLHLGDAVVIFDELERKLFRHIESLGTMSVSDVSTLALPAPEELLPHKDANQVAELRNHVFVSRYITESALNNPGTSGLSVADIKQLSVAMLRGTDAENSHLLN
ncbi:hypothetical protein F5884DRAFT_744523 [Xylogone sp. PMI_703]|nr:hypothetical protein F5884DRAFT_744523 [Xylogone sp. PMI_703]